MIMVAARIVARVVGRVLDQEAEGALGEVSAALGVRLHQGDRRRWRCTCQREMDLPGGDAPARGRWTCPVAMHLPEGDGVEPDDRVAGWAGYSGQYVMRPIARPLGPGPGSAGSHAC
jgi:hypothetical protein